MSLILFSAPWFLLALYVILLVRIPPPLPAAPGPHSGRRPMVSVIIPARNEEVSIEACIVSLGASTYRPFEIVVVDDESQDRTAAIVLDLKGRLPVPVHLARGRPVPEGWLGKPWACFQGAQVAKGDLLLFVDADTVHHPGLLDRAVAGMGANRADVLTVIGKQVMETFWEQLLQPQFFMLLALRYPRAGAVKEPKGWRNAIANGQYLMFRRPVYETVGGHAAVKGEVVEDLRMAQVLVRDGRRVVVRGDRGLETRMYRSLGTLVEGWSKNVATAARQTTPRWLRPWILPVSLVCGFGLWVAPPMILGWTLAVGAGNPLLAWSIFVSMINVVLWSLASRLMKGSPLVGLLYPVGAIVAGFIVARSWARGARIHWKGRRYMISTET